MTDAVRLETRLPIGARAALAAAGAFAIAMPAWELRQPLLEPGWHTAPFALIVAGAAVVGLTFLACAIAGDAFKWRVEAGVLTLTRSSPLRRRTDRFTAADVAAIHVRREVWDSRNDTWRVVLSLQSGSTLQTPDQPSAEAADALRLRILAALGADEGMGPPSSNFS